MIQKVTTSYGKARMYRAGSGPKVMIVPGFSESITHNKRLVDILAHKGYDAFTYDQPRRDSFTNPIVRLQDIVLEILDATLPTSQKVYIVTHSLGAAASLRAALKHPERVDRLILMQPSGLSDKLTFIQLLRRFGKKTAKIHTDAVKENSTASASTVYTLNLRQVMRIHAASTVQIIRNPLLAFKEASVAIQYGIADEISAVEELGIPVNIVMVRNDELFSMKRATEYDHIMKLPGSYSSIAHEEARHDTFWMHPEQTAELIDTFISQSLSKP